MDTQVFIGKPEGCCDDSQGKSAGARDEAGAEAGAGAGDGARVMLMPGDEAGAARVPVQRSHRVALAIGVPLVVGVLVVGVVVVLLKYPVLCPQEPQVRLQVPCVSTGTFSEPFNITEKTFLKEKDGKVRSVYEVFTAPEGGPESGYLLLAELKVDSQRPNTGDCDDSVTIFFRREGSTIDEERLNKPISKLPTTEVLHRELDHLPEGSKVYLWFNCDDDVIKKISIRAYRLCHEEHM